MTETWTFPSNLKFPVVVPGVGPIPAPGMIIGEAPGRKEIEKLSPFCGASGKVLDEALEATGISRNEVFITNIFKGDVGSGNRNPTSIEVDDHRILLEEELRAVAPIAILLLGRVATSSFFPESRRMGDYVHTIHRVNEVIMIPCWHPAATLYDRSKRAEFNEIVDLFVREAYG